MLLAACGGSVQANSDYIRAMQYLEGNGVAVDQAKGMELLQKASDGGNAEAQLMLGFFYEKGQNGLTVDHDKAMTLFLKAAKQGNRDAEYNAGLSYVRAEGDKQNYKEALRWFTLAAMQDDVGSQYNLGVMYLNGEGTVADPLQAYAWFTLAGEKGYEGSKEGQDAARAAMTDEQANEIPATLASVRRQVKVPASKPAQIQIKSQPL